MTRRRYSSLWERIIANCTPDWTNMYNGEPCLLWQGTLNARGYGHIGIRDRARKCSVPRLVHRVVLDVFKGLDLRKVENSRHMCGGQKNCCHPEHLLPGTRMDNVNDHYGPPDDSVFADYGQPR